MSIYSVLGQKIKNITNGTFNEGLYFKKWYGINEQGIKVSSGVYIYMLKINNKLIYSKKLILLK